MYSSENGGFYPPLAERPCGDLSQVNSEVVQRWEFGPVLFFAGRSVYPEYLNDAMVLACPSSPSARELVRSGRWSRPDGPNGHRAGGSIIPELLDQISYFYPGYILKDEWVAEFGTRDASPAFVEALEALFECGADRNTEQWSFYNDLGEECRALRLKDGIERFLITDINDPSKTNFSQSMIPVMFDRIDLDPLGFNHLPGGGNVLYMDGHVEWVRYPNVYPLSRAWAEVADRLNL